jgi:hypothetical protein
LSSQEAPFNMNQPTASVGLNEGQMRELVGYLVARDGDEQAAVRTAVAISQRILCEPILCEDDRAERALIHDESIGTLAGSLMCVAHVRETISADALAAVAERIPGLGVFD